MPINFFEYFKLFSFYFLLLNDFNRGGIPNLPFTAVSSPQVEPRDRQILNPALVIYYTVVTWNSMESKVYRFGSIERCWEYHVATVP